MTDFLNLVPKPLDIVDFKIVGHRTPPPIHLITFVSIGPKFRFSLPNLVRREPSTSGVTIRSTGYESEFTWSVSSSNLYEDDSKLES
jgi:hypothetical protein